jgi:L-rhamnose mutarotase
VQRICFVLHIRREKIDEYRKCHAAIWPTMVEALQDAGWKNYSLFLRSDGLLIGYFETENLASSHQKMQTSPVNTRWQREMAHCFEDLGETMPDQNIIPLSEVFHLS